MTNDWRWICSSHSTGVSANVQPYSPRCHCVHNKEPGVVPSWDVGLSRLKDPPKLSTASRNSGERFSITIESVSKTPKKSRGRDWQSPKIENACGSFPSARPLSYTFCKLGSMTLGITGKFFQAETSASVVGGTGVGVTVRVGAGV